MNNNCTLYLVRHGESEANAKAIRGGDTILTERGKKQVQAYSDKTKEVQFDAVFSSPLQRTQQTAAIIATERKLEIITREALRERHSGVIDGKSHQEIKDILDQYNKLRESMPYEKSKHLTAAEGFESDDTIISRFITELREIAVAYSGKTVLVASHWGLMRSLLVHLGYTTYKKIAGYKLLNTASIILECDGVDFFVKDVKGLVKAKQYYQ